MSYDKTAEDIVTNLSNNPHFDDIVEQSLANPNRRRLMASGAGAAALSFMSLTGCGDSDSNEAPAVTPPPSAPPPVKVSALGFPAIAKSLADVVVVPPGYQASVLFRLGDPLNAATSDYRNDGTESGASFEFRAGDHHDGMDYYGLSATGTRDVNASGRGLMCINHEALTPAFLHTNGVTTVSGVRTVPDECIKEMNAMGVSIIEVSKAANGSWSYVRNSSFNRRVTTITDTILSGPAAGSSFMITKHSTNGTRTRGTANNCAHGTTPWGTYLACEENWAGYFRRVTAVDNPKRTAKELTSFARYGVQGNGRELWATATAADPNDTVFSRWNAERLGTSADGSDDFRNAPNTFGWNVEIDPYSPTSTPKKRTAMGRFAHEGAWVGKVTAGQPLVWYMGCDSRGEYIYKYVSNANWDPADATRGLAAGDKYLDNGKLYVARFNADGTGAWLELTFGVGNIVSTNTTYPFANQADVLINARLAADAAGATKMDRPEWGAVDPFNGNVYMTLTNNNSTLRSVALTDAANPRSYTSSTITGTVQRGNPNGHIIRWAEVQGNNAAVAFGWDIYLFGARADANPLTTNLSKLTAANDMSSPDGLWFGGNGILWIQTDDGAYTDVTNCMMLAAIPGRMGDGGAVTVPNTDGTNTKSVTTYIGAASATTETNLRRFLVGPKDCEITGVTQTPDYRTMFVNIQHPGEDTAAADFAAGRFTSNWPQGGTSRPRSATIVITRTDGGVIGV